MLSLKSKFVAGLATATMAASLFGGAAFANTRVTVSHNGAFSHTFTGVHNNSFSVKSQSNDSFNGNFVHSDADSGDNHSSFNTGGSNTVTSGHASSTVNITNNGDRNTASTTDCGCGNQNTNVDVSGNGAFSSNGVFVSNNTVSVVHQSNTSTNINAVGSSADSGGNSSSFNTGGSTNVTSGSANSTVNITNGGNTNTLN